MSKEADFTPIELLVVIAIIAVLMAILVPSLSLVREQARSIACRSNVADRFAIEQNFHVLKEIEGAVQQFPFGQLGIRSRPMFSSIFSITS